MARAIVLSPDLSIRGGTNNVIHALASSAPKGIEILLLHFGAPSVAYEFPLGVAVRSLLGDSPVPDSRVGRSVGSAATIPALVRATKAWRADVVVSFLPRASVCNVLARRVARLSHRVVVCERNLTARHYGSSLVGRAFLPILGAAYRDADLVISNAHALAREVSRTYRVPANRCAVVHNPLNVEQIRIAAQESVRHEWFDDAVPVIGTVGRLIPQKNHQLLLDALERVNRHLECRLMILGEGAARRALESRAAALGLASRVAFLGWRENPHAWISRLQLFVLSSDYEGFPNALMEAMACGIPVISTDCRSGPAEILRDGRDGVLTPVGDVDALANAIMDLLQDEARRVRAAAAAGARSEDFAVEEVAARFWSVACQ